MKKIPIVLSVFFLACSGSSPSHSDILLDSLADSTEISSNDQQETTKDVSTDKGTVDTGNDMGNGEDVYVQPKDCRSQLTAYQCLNDKDCDVNEVCSGVVSCGGKNCFGLCDVYPGTCVPKYKPVFCSTSSQCPQFYVCNGARACNGGACLGKTIPGLCRYAGPGRCYTDSDCSKGSYCAQAVYCGNGPCWAQELPGVCVAKPKKGCLDDRDCDKGKECHNAKLCSSFENCPVISGTCETRESCSKPMDCANPEHSFCEEGFVCQASTCNIPNSQGYCIKQPGPSACWTNKDCVKGYMCKGAMPCKPGSYCDDKGFVHVGYCVKNPSFQGIELLLPDKIVAGQPFPVAIINHTGLTFAIRKTYTFSYQYKKPDGKFVTLCPDSSRPQSCMEAGPLIALPDGRAFTRLEKVERSGTYHVEFHVYKPEKQGSSSVAHEDIIYDYTSRDFQVLDK